MLGPCSLKLHLTSQTFTTVTLDFFPPPMPQDLAQAYFYAKFLLPLSQVLLILQLSALAYLPEKPSLTPRIAP